MTLKKIGPYELEGILGRGGMGTVYRGRHTDTNQHHAIKVLAPRFAEDQHFRGRFEAEINALLELNHENIVSLLSYGQDDGQLFFAMELVDGQSLFQMQKAGHKFDWRQVLVIARDCANGLRHAHDRGIIHRDLKPGNLMMANPTDGSQGRVKLTDFGIAKRFGSSQNTGTNILGTMDFMSPEQARGGPITARSDLYSLGTVLFTLLTGRPPFSGNSVEQSLRNLTSVPAPSINGIDPAIPKPIDNLVSKLMAKKVEDRIPTALALLHKISDVEHELRSDASAQTSHGKLSSQDTRIQSEDDEAADTAIGALVVGESSVRHATGDSDAVGFVHGQTAATKGEMELSPVDAAESGGTEDYFNQVTESLRRKHIDKAPGVESRRKGLLPLVLALAGVIVLGGYGWIRVSTPPAAEQLFATIELNSDDPEKVVDQIGLFLKNYPDDPRAQKLAELQSVGVAIKDYQSLKNTLTVRARSAKGLTDMEQTFLDLTSLAKTDARLAGEKMAAFALVNEAVALDQQDVKCVHAAKSYALKLNHELRTKAQARLGRIHNAFFKASEIEDPKKALKMCQSLLELYSDSDFSALQNPKQGTKALGRVSERIAELENQIRMEMVEAQQKAQAAKEKAIKDVKDPKERVEAPVNEDPIEEYRP